MWTETANKLSREFIFNDFSEAFAFMTRVALAAEKATGAHTLFLADTHHAISNLVQGFNAHKKTLVNSTLLVLNQVDKNKKTVI